LQGYAERLKTLNIVQDSIAYLNKALMWFPDKQILVEGANGALLDIDFGMNKQTIALYTI